MPKRFIKILIILLIIAAFILSNLRIFAQEQATTTPEIESSPEAEPPPETDPLAERQKLEEELAKLEEEISHYEGEIGRTQAEKKTLQNEIYILRSKINKINLQIEHNNIMVEDLSIQIEDTKSSITKTTSKIEESRQKLAQILQALYEEEQKTIIEILLFDELSDFFSNLKALEALLSRNQELLDNIKKLKGSLENQKDSLDTEKSDLESLLKIQILQKQESQTVKQEQEWLLEQTKGQEAEYQNLLSERKEKAAEIRSRIFELIGVKEAPTFGQALELAKEVERVTGVRPAFLLAVMTQESNIGKNVGQCYLPRDPAEIRKKRSMAFGPPASKRDDVSLFLEICKELGRDPYNTPISCPMSYGWGGAMGPAQFIPSTWAYPYSSPTKVSYKDRVKEITGKVTADPWDIKDAFLAAALYLGDYGAKKQTPNDEWRAAMVYFSGSTNTRYRFYGDSVLSIAKQYEADIAELEGA